MPDALQRLAELFEKFPGIGPRQAQRFVQHILRLPSSARRDLVDSIRDIGSSVHQCPECMRFHTGEKNRCSICADTARDHGVLAVVATDADLSALERSRTFRGRYFVLGGLLSLASEKINGLRIKELATSLPKRQELREIILAFPANPEGDATAARVRDELQSSGKKISTLGRGLSTGSELEYADPETLKSALDNRK